MWFFILFVVYIYWKSVLNFLHHWIYETISSKSERWLVLRAASMGLFHRIIKGSIFSFAWMYEMLLKFRFLLCKINVYIYTLSQFQSIHWSVTPSFSSIVKYRFYSIYNWNLHWAECYLSADYHKVNICLEWMNVKLSFKNNAKRRDTLYNTILSKS